MPTLSIIASGSAIIRPPGFLPRMRLQDLIRGGTRGAVQLVGHHRADARLLSIARRVEMVLGYSTNSSRY